MVLAPQEENKFVLDEKGIKPNKSKSIQYIINNNCWECISHYKNKDGYHNINRTNKKMLVHRYVYIIYKGDIPKNKVVMHNCDNPSCINPEHLRLGTQKANIRDMHEKGRNKILSGTEHPLYGKNHKNETKKKQSEKKQKVSKEQILEIKTLLSEETNESNRKKDKRIGVLFNVSSSTIGRIRTGLSSYK